MSSKNNSQKSIPCNHRRLLNIVVFEIFSQVLRLTLSIMYISSSLVRRKPILMFRRVCLAEKWSSACRDVLYINNNRQLSAFFKEYRTVVTLPG